MFLTDRAFLLTTGRSSQRLDHVIGVTPRALGAEIAWLAVPDDGDRIVYISRAGPGPVSAPLTGSFSEAALGRRDGIVIPDARQDPRFRDNPLVVGPKQIRFFAGYPVESPSGTIIGTLCVLDSEPRDAEDGDLSLLRAMARLVEGALRCLGPDLPQGRARV